MAAPLSVSAHLESQSVVLMECTIPAELTVDEWRRQRRPRVLRLAACDHIHDATSRYDHARKQLTFLLVCPVCGTEKVVDTIAYEPHFTPRAPQEESGGATIHQLPVRRHDQPLRRAA
jgi:hypothetical protein